MSEKKKVSKPRKPKTKTDAQPDLGDLDFSPLVTSDTEIEVRPSKARGRPAPTNKNDIAKSRIMLIIDMLSGDSEFDEKTLRHNVAITVKHLKEVSALL